MLLVPNDFPYDFEPDCVHYVLWKVGGAGEPGVMKLVAGHLPPLQPPQQPPQTTLY